MKFFSTRDTEHQHPVSLSEAVLTGLAPDGGLYLPETVNPLPSEFFDDIESMPLDELNYRVVRQFVGEAFPEKDLRAIVSESLNFDIPVVPVSEGIYSLELFHGPTLAFKDVGARFMARLMGYFAQHDSEPYKVIVATSGDTGSAVAAGFFKVSGVDVYVLYPSGKVTPLQEKQLTTWGENIHAIEVKGVFDDCQKLVKAALSDPALKGKGKITSANSINIARLIPQSLYYFHAYRALRKQGKPLVISVPSGNFGNLTGGILAAQMGLPVHQFIAATNANDVVPEFLETGVYSPRKSVSTISNAMDVGNPSNFERLTSLLGATPDTFGAKIKGFAFSDDETREAISRIYADHGYIADPHGAVGFLGVEAFQREMGREFTFAFLETAHPAKFVDVVEETLNQSVSIPDRLQAFAEKAKKAALISADYTAFMEVLGS